MRNYDRLFNEIAISKGTHALDCNYIVFMELTEKQLECMRLGADKTLSLWCIYKYKSREELSIIYPNEYERFDDKWNLWRTYKDFWLYNNDDNDEMVSSSEYEIIWSPINWWRIMYLYRTTDWVDYPLKIEKYIENNRLCFNQTILDRPEELIDLVLSFLQSLCPQTTN
jgi:hypothetical protein